MPRPAVLRGAHRCRDRRRGGHPHRLSQDAHPPRPRRAARHPGGPAMNDRDEHEMPADDVALASMVREALTARAGGPVTETGTAGDDDRLDAIEEAIAAQPT